MFFFTSLRNELGEGVQVCPTLDFNPVREKQCQTQGSRYGFKGSKVQGTNLPFLLYYTIYNKYNSVIYTFKFRETLTQTFSFSEGVKIKGCSLNGVNGEVTTYA